MNLRDYQVEAVDACMEEWKENDATLLVLPTGGGKTVVAAEIIQRFRPRKAIFLAHREELIWQARDRITSHTGLECDIEMGELIAQANLFRPSSADVIISTIQTQIAGGDAPRMTKFCPNDFGLLVIDESHHAPADSYGRVIEYFKRNTSLKVLGITATPDRADEKALGKVFQTVAYDYEIIDAIRDGWLVPIEQQMVNIQGLDFSAIRTTAGDLNGADLAAVMEAEKNLQGVAGASIEILGTMRAIVFAASVHQAEMLADIFNRHRPGMAAWICGKTEKIERRRLLHDFAANQIQVMVNVGVLTEGFDDAGVEAIIMARPTKSRALYSQQAGRGTRPLPGIVDSLATAEERCAAIAASAKPSVKIIDFVGNSGKHKLMTTADILGGNMSDEVIVRAEKIAREKGQSVRMDETLLEAEEQLREEAERRRQAEEARRNRLVAKVSYTTKIINPFDVFAITPQRERGWDEGKVVSEKMANIIRKMGADPEGMPYAQAKQLVGEQFRRWKLELCTAKQAAVLNRYGYETREMKFSEASALMNRLAANRWKALPVEVIA